MVFDQATQLPTAQKDDVYRIVGSKSHPSPETQAYIEKLEKEKGKVEIVSMGSSLKLCLVAEGAADAYPRFAPTMEWDTAAGQAIVESSGATVINWEAKERMRYNKENLLNSWFLARRN
jgi:3'(2'), 5'-bisphosphate nucleotidase